MRFLRSTAIAVLAFAVVVGVIVNFSLDRGRGLITGVRNEIIISGMLHTLKNNAINYLEECESSGVPLPTDEHIDIDLIKNRRGMAMLFGTIDQYIFYYRNGRYWVGREIRDSNILKIAFSRSLDVGSPLTRRKLESLAVKEGFFGSASPNEPPVSTDEQYSFKRGDRAIWALARDIRDAAVGDAQSAGENFEFKGIVISQAERSGMMRYVTKNIP